MLALSAAKPPPILQPTTKAHLPYLPGAKAKSGAKTSGVAVPAHRPESLLVNKATGMIAKRSGVAVSAHRPRVTWEPSLERSRSPVRTSWRPTIRPLSPLSAASAQATSSGKAISSAASAQAIPSWRPKFGAVRKAASAPAPPRAAPDHTNRLVVIAAMDAAKALAEEAARAPSSADPETRRKDKATSLSEHQAEKERLRAEAHQAAEKAEADKPGKAASSGQQRVKKEEVEDEKSDSGQDLPPLKRAKFSKVKREQLEAMKSESSSDLQTTKEELIDPVEAQYSEWLESDPGEDPPPPPWRKKRKKRKKKNKQAEKPGAMGLLNNIEPGGAGGRAHEKLEVVIDSGASACALPLGWCNHYPTRPLGTGERTTYRTANGGIVNASGRKSIFGETTAGKNIGLSFVEMEVHRPLASVSQMVKKGNMVVFGHPKKGAYVYNKATGLEHPLEERNGIYILPVWVTENSGDFEYKAADGDLHVTAVGETTTASPGGASSSFHRLARWP